MSSAVVDPLPPRRLVALRGRHVAFVVADPSHGDDPGPAAALLEWSGTVSLLSIDEIVSQRPDAVVLRAGSGSGAGLASLRRLRKELPAARLIVLARDDDTAVAAREALNAGADPFLPPELAEPALAPAVDAVLASLVCSPRAPRRLLAKPTFSHREKEV